MSPVWNQCCNHTVSVSMSSSVCTCLHVRESVFSSVLLLVAKSNQVHSLTDSTDRQWLQYCPIIIMIIIISVIIIIIITTTDK